MSLECGEYLKKKQGENRKGPTGNWTHDLLAVRYPHMKTMWRKKKKEEEKNTKQEKSLLGFFLLVSIFDWMTKVVKGMDGWPMLKT